MNARVIEPRLERGPGGTGGLSAGPPPPDARPTAPPFAAWAAIPVLAALFLPRTAAAYVEAPFTLGKILGDSSHVLVMAVEQVDKQKNLIVFRKVRDLKGTHPGETIKHAIEQRGFHPREWQNVMAWAEAGKTAVFFHNGGAGEVCIDNYWYQVYAGDWWGMSHAEPFFLRSYAGKPEKLAAAVAAMLAGQEVAVPCMADGDKNALHARNGRLLRMKASLKITEYNFQRDFVDWGAGADEFRSVAGMPGFSHFIALNRMGPGSGAVLPVDLNGDGKLDLCLSGAGRVAVLQNTGGSFDEVRLPIEVGARAVGWADFDGDGKPDLLAAAPAGLRLFRYNGKTFEDFSAALPDEGYGHPTAAAWIDYDGDRRPDILAADGFRGLRLYRNRGAALPGAPLAQPKLGPWRFAGPFDNVDKRGVATAYPPEREFDPARQYPGKLNEKVAWRDGSFPDGQQHNLRLFKPECSTNFVIYLHREIETAGAAELPVSLGCDDSLALWLNGKKLYQDAFYHPYAPDQVQLKLKLRPGKNALLLKVCQGDGDCSFSFAVKPPLPPAMSQPQAPPTFPVTPLLFDDVADAAGLGTGGAAGGLRGDHLAIADVNGDGRPDVLYSAGSGVLLINTPQKFVEMKDSGIAYRAGGVMPAFGDYNGDGRPDLFVPQQGVSKLFRNEGGGRFADVTAQAGDLGRTAAVAHCAAWADFLGKGKPDLVVGCLKGPNRYFRNEGNGTLTEATDPIGLTHRVYNTCGLAACDINNDKTPDLVFNNEGQEAVALLASPAWFAAPPVAKVAKTEPRDPGGAKPGPTAAAAAPGKERVEGPATKGAAAAGFPAQEAPPEEDDAPAPAYSTSVVSGPSDPVSARVPATEAELAWGPGMKWTAVLGAGVALLVLAAGVVRWLLLAALATALVAGSTVVAADWPTARGNPQRTGNVDGLAGPMSPKVLWVYKAPEHYVASPVPGAKALYVPGIGGFNTGVLHAVARSAQAPERLLWSKTAPYVTRPTVCAPALAGEFLVFGDGMHQTDDALLYCVHAGTGLPLWQLPVPGKLVHLEAAPTIDKDRVFACGGDAGVLCVDLKRVTLDGKEQDVAAVMPDLAQRWAAMAARFEQDRKKDPLLAIPPSEEALPKPVAKLHWQKGRGVWHIDAPPVVVGESLLVASAYLDEERIGKRALACLKAADGSLVWETPLELNPWGGPTVAGSLVVVGCSNIRFDRKLVPQARGEVLAVELATGKVRWRQPAGGVLSPVAVHGETAVYTSTDGRVVARSVATGQQLWAYQGPSPFFAGPASAGDFVYAADLAAKVHALHRADGRPLWVFDAAADPSVQSQSTVFGSPVVDGGDLYLATCNLDGPADQPGVIVCLSDKATGVPLAAATIAVDRQRRTISIPCKVAPRKLPTLKEIYPLEVVASFPSPRGQKAHETIVTFSCKPSEVHQALESLGLKPGKPARGEGQQAAGPEIRVYLEVPGFAGRPRVVPVEKLMVDLRTGKPMPPLRWIFTGSALRQPDPMKDDKVYGADLSGTLIALMPVTDETVLQTHLTMKEERLVKLDTNKNILPEEGTDVRLVLEAK